MTDPVVSVIVTVRNAAMVVGDQLEALGRQTYVGPFEVIVVDHGSTDGTAAVASLYHHRFTSLSVLGASEQLERAHARNVGATAARGDVLIFRDVDEVVAPSWLEQVVAELIDADLVVPGRSESPTVADAASVTLAVRTSVFRELGGYGVDDDSITPDVDIEIVQRAARAGYRVRSAADASADHPLATRPRLRQHCDI